MFEETKHKAKSRRMYAIRLGQERNNFRIGHRVAWERRIVVRQEAEFDVANACRAPVSHGREYSSFFSFFFFILQKRIRREGWKHTWWNEHVKLIG